MENIGELIQEYRKNKNMSQTELAKRTGISQGYLGDLENNRKDGFPTFEKLQLLAKELTNTKEEEENFIIHALSFKLHIGALTKLKEPNEKKTDEIAIKGEVLEDKAHLEEKEINFIRVSTDKKTGKRIFALVVKDDSLALEIEKNSKIIIDPDLNDWDNINNKIALIKYKNEYYIKRVNLLNGGTFILLKSLNKNYSDIIIPSTEIEDFKCCGKVIKAIIEKNFD